MRAIVNFAPIMICVASRKENSMKEIVINRLEQEQVQFRTELVSGAYTAAQLVEEAYQIAVKEQIVECMHLIYGESQLSNNIWNWLNHQERILDYLYKLWIHSDVTFGQELADVLMNEMYYDKETSKYE